MASKELTIRELGKKLADPKPNPHAEQLQALKRMMESECQVSITLINGTVHKGKVTGFDTYSVSFRSFENNELRLFFKHSISNFLIHGA